jgi:hypothetical protein
MILNEILSSTPKKEIKKKINNNSSDIKLNFNEDNNIQKGNISQSSISSDLNTNKYKQLNQEKNEIEYETFNPNSNIKLFEKTEQSILNNINKSDMSINKIFSDFNPYDVNNFLGKPRNNFLSSFQKKNSYTEYNSNNNKTIYNISPITSNYKLLLNNKKIEEDKLIKDKFDPKKYFILKHQKESRRMIIEYLKILLNEKKENLNSILSKNLINPIILLKEKKIEKEKSTENIILINKKPSNITLGEQKFSQLTLNNNKSNSNNSMINVNNQNNNNSSLNLMNNFLNNINDESPEKISLLTFLSIPRIMKMIITKDKKIPFLFQTSPTIISCSYGIESYIFKWSDCKNFSQIGFFDFINVDNCSLNQFDNKIFQISISSNNNMEKIYYFIEAENNQIALKYIHSIYFISQVIKCRAFKRKIK